MGRRSIKENKSIYHLCREEAGLTRAEASYEIAGMTESRLEKIESGKTPPYPEDIVNMASVYRRPDLCNIYCAQMCEVGRDKILAVECNKGLAQITLEMLSTLNTITREKDRLVDIVVDGEITEDEMQDFLQIQDNLEKMELAIESLKLWVKKAVAEKNTDKK